MFSSGIAEGDLHFPDMDFAHLSQDFSEIFHIRDLTARPAFYIFIGVIQKGIDMFYKQLNAAAAAGSTALAMAGG